MITLLRLTGYDIRILRQKPYEPLDGWKTSYSPVPGERTQNCTDYNYYGDNHRSKSDAT